jgi:biopolymer transport protein ExbB/TolQ
MLIERLLRVALLGSEWVLYLLLALSVISIAIMFERWLFFWKRRVNIDTFRGDVLKRLETRGVEGTSAGLSKERSVHARVLRESLHFSSAGAETMLDVADAELSHERQSMESGLNFLGTVGNNAPFVGLFGTVLGVITAFHALGSAGQNASAMGGVMGGIAEALVATGVGLFVALPAVVAYNILQKRIGDIESETLALVKLASAVLRAHPAEVENEKAGAQSGSQGLSLVTLSKSVT